MAQFRLLLENDMQTHPPFAFPLPLKVAKIQQYAQHSKSCLKICIKKYFGNKNFPSECSKTYEIFFLIKLERNKKNFESFCVQPLLSSCGVTSAPKSGPVINFARILFDSF